MSRSTRTRRRKRSRGRRRCWRRRRCRGSGAPDAGARLAERPEGAVGLPSPGVINVDLEPDGAIGPVRDVVHRWAKRTLTLEFGNISNRDFARLDAVVDYLGQRRDDHRDDRLDGSNPVLAFGHFVQLGSSVARLHRVLADANAIRGAATMTIEPGLWRDHGAGERVHHLRDPDPANPLPHLACTMRLSDPNEVQGQVFASPKPQYRRSILLAFTEAVRVID